MRSRVMIFAYGVACYASFLATFVYAIGFLGDIAVPRSINAGAGGPLGPALAIDLALLGLFSVQHSVMARPWFKRAWTRLIPRPAERSTYVLLSSVALGLLFWQWRSIGGPIWEVGSPAGRVLIRGVYAVGWGLLLISTFLIDHFELFGLRQVWEHLRGRPAPTLAFRTPGLYRHVRHPIYLAWLCIFWATPMMTAAHLVFALSTTAYILIAVRFEERDLIRAHGDDYRRYREEVPMLIPVGRSRPGAESEDEMMESERTIIARPTRSGRKADFEDSTVISGPAGATARG